jgi:uroporphyrinogen-III synthase
MSGLRVLITRPQPDAARSAERLAAHGHRVIVEPLLELERVSVEKIPPGPFAALAVTSANAMRVARDMRELDRFRSMPVFAVGEHSAQAAAEAEFHNVTACGGDAAALAKSIGGRLQRGARVLHLAGEDRAQDLGALLAPAAIDVEILVVYRMRPVESLSAAAIAALKSSHADVVLHYAPRSAATFAALVERHGLKDAARRMRHLCLSPAVAEPLGALGMKTETAVRPDEPALFDLLGD